MITEKSEMVEGVDDPHPVAVTEQVEQDEVNSPVPVPESNEVIDPADDDVDDDDEDDDDFDEEDEDIEDEVEDETELPAEED